MTEVDAMEEVEASGAREETEEEEEDQRSFTKSTQGQRRLSGFMD